MTGHKIGHVFAGAIVGWTLYLCGSAAWAAPLVLSEFPLFLSASADPNVMLMVDNSGSMQNIVPDVPYDPNTVYLSTCPADNTVPESTQADLRISSGAPRIRYSSTNYQFGSGSGQKCFASQSNYMARLHADNSGSPSGYLAAQYTGNYLNWYFDTTSDPTGCSNTWVSGRKPCTQSRMMIAKTAGTSLINIMSSGMRVGLSTYNNGNGGQLVEVVGSLTSSKRTTLQSAINGLSASGATPLAETLSDIGFYFSRGATNLTLHPNSAPQIVSRTSVFDNGYTRHASWGNGSDPVQSSCQKSFAVLLTDGRPQNDQNISSHLSDYDGDCAGGGCGTYDRKPDREYESAGSDYLDDVAMALNEMDLRSDLVDSRGIKNNLISHFISFADDQAINDPLMADAASQGGGDFLIAGNEAELTAAFQAAFTSIVQATSSASAVATNSTRLDTETLIYQARFRSDDWTGQLLAFELETNGSLGALRWDAATLIPTPASRNIFTRNGVGAAIPFLWSDLDASQQSALNQRPDGTLDGLGQQRLSWLRGDTAQEQRLGGGFRNRTAVLGDIVNSDPVFVGAQNFGYKSLPPLTPGQSTYQAYLQSKVNSDGRPVRPMLYVSANDGMLHGVDAISGREHFAYIPSTLVSQLNKLPDPAYTHRYYVDGQTFVGDAHINRGGTERWATVLVGTTGAGGRTVFALDVTDPHNFSTSDVLWEFTDPDLGYTIGQPVVARMADGTWAAVFGNGYNSNNHRAMLFVVRLSDGTLLRKIDTGIGNSTTPNGLAAPALLPNGSRTITSAYAGDLRGNLWKFDLSQNQPNNWRVAYGGGTPAPLFVATDSSNVVQPITAPIEIGRHPQNGHMIYFGTGKYLETGDNVVGANPQVQTFYGLWDKTTSPGGPISGRSQLQQQSIQFEGTTANSNTEVRVTSNTSVDWVTKRGWYIDLRSPVTGAAGERVVASPILRGGRIIFPTLIPSPNPCEFGGTSWLMEMNAVSGARLLQPPLDINEDGQINDDDLVTVVVGGVTVTVPVSAVKSREGIIRTPAVVGAGEVEYKIASGTSGNVEVLRERGAFDRARGSWRQLR